MTPQEGVKEALPEAQGNGRGSAATTQTPISGGAWPWGCFLAPWWDPWKWLLGGLFACPTVTPDTV